MPRIAFDWALYDQGRLSAKHKATMNKRRNFIKTCCMSAASAAFYPLTDRVKASHADRPNIIFIMLDEWGYYEWSGVGHRKHITPNLDKFAKDGIQFTQCVAGAPVCAPTRSALMTGQHTGHTTVRNNNGGLDQLRAEDITTATVLKEAGYATGGFGKWKLGNRGTSGIPERHGFDVFFGYYDQHHAHTYYPKFLIKNSEKISLKGNNDDFHLGETFAHTEIFKESINFIKKNEDRPFFCYLPWTPPHGQWGFPKDDLSWELFKNRKGWDYGQKTKNDARVYAEMLHMVDRQVGKISALLKQLDIADNTIIFLCGDNGGQDYFPSKEFPDGFFAPHNDPVTGKRIFKGEKGTLYEGGLRIPFFVKWPGKIRAGTVSDHLSYFPDIMPTLCEIGKGEVPENCDGISFLPTLLGEDGQKQHKYLYWERKDNWQVAREGNWKLHKKEGVFELYNLDTDISEKKNMAGKHSEIVDRLNRYIEEAHVTRVNGEIYDAELSQKARQTVKKRNAHKKTFPPGHFVEGVL